MAEFEDKLNSILGNQEAMSQIMSLAHSLSGENGPQHSEAPENPSADSPATSGVEQPMDLSSLLGQIDPNIIRMGMDIVHQMQSTNDRNMALLNALRPFLKEERRGRLDRAIEIVRMTKLIRAAFGALGGEGAQESV